MEEKEAANERLSGSSQSSVEATPRHKRASPQLKVQEIVNKNKRTQDNVIQCAHPETHDLAQADIKCNPC